MLVLGEEQFETPKFEVDEQVIDWFSLVRGCIVVPESHW